MEPITRVTFTGVDEATDLDRLIAISHRFPIAEWGILYSEDRAREEGGRSRYPRLEWIAAAVSRLSEEGVNLAIHLCGRTAREAMHEKLPQPLRDVLWQVNRIQINMVPDEKSSTDPDHFVGEVVGKFPGKKILLQYNDKTAEFCARAAFNGSVAFLFDASGGRGISPQEWTSPPARMQHCRFGFAGGLGPENIAKELPKIAEAAKRPYWIDMEGKLRNSEDRFDLGACERVIDQVEAFLLDQNAQKCAHLEASGKAQMSVSEMDDFWLSWWAGLAMGYAMSAPPEDAVRPTYLHRSSASYQSFDPVHDQSDFSDILNDEEVPIGSLFKEGRWVGVTPDGRELEGHSRRDAMLRARIVHTFGETVPTNPMHSEVFKSKVSRGV